jgi:VWFA-related protein
MYRRAAIAALLLQAVLRAAPQQGPPDAATEPVVLKSTSRAVQLDVFVNDPSGRPVHGLQKGDFFVTDNGRRRDIRIFAGEIDADQTAPASATTEAPGVYSNRFGMGDSRIVTAMVLDAVPRPEGLQRNPGRFASIRPEFSVNMARFQAISAIHRMAPGQTMAIYAACPELRVVQGYTSDPDRLVASLKAFVPPPFPRSGKKEPQSIEALVPPMLSALRDVAGRISGASGRKSVVWISQAYGTELNIHAISGATDATVAAFNDANVPLYAVDTRFSPTCEPPVRLPGDQSRAVDLTCSQPPDISDEWMDYLAQATGGRAFSGGKVTGVRYYRDPQEVPMGGIFLQGQHGLESDRGVVSDALHFAADESRYAYEMGFYVPESELDSKIHTLRVTVPGKPKFDLRYRSGYTASAGATTPPTAQELTEPDSSPKRASQLNPDEVGIDGTMEISAKAKNEVRVSLALTSETLTRAADGAVAIDATFTQTDDSGKQLAMIQETVRVPAPETQTEMVPYTRALKLANGAILLHVRIRDQATNRVGSIAIPIGKP